MLDNVRVVMVGTSHSGNIGSAARAMKTMGFSQLVLVAPGTEIDGKSTALAAGASDVLANVQIFDTLEEAIAPCELVIGTSARSRTLELPLLNARQSAQRVVQEGQHAQVAMVFGRERTGLTNDELKHCHFHVNVATNPEYSSLNLAMAVQILCYEVRMAHLDNKMPSMPEVDYPQSQDVENFYTHLEKTLFQIGFIVPNHPGKVMDKLRRMFNRIRMEQNELNTMRGILSAMERTARGETIFPDKNKLE
ncbi:tRNA (cytosine(32)/uridine(32)-2'-O)-methyltransferase TrmJ [Celerinatantimonas diazotrophica]|uniref:tRNA (cytidine/uridine-2'-O-)-methyltransferase TrmJ n=1 Tax=Celerinatantimonas diazotrophica TaxID=412034 RepID=A0A4V2PPU4_9GAMM|nr:tRNA (cytosine(32)/uridine(32)-2'-O)-methyltransferase TrmJ [Celerinatantimonas diazotrophica]TCK52211.1 tRNA (cytidine32/uridine32-2'-O)-methyltransferase [Celerinatantimonas diazotrophica]CAG9296083.1 tRNA (cytidine/uridine-2'-O-)-methyltransferase TrmJ [Celerinatantimonas diazotrophica]